MTHDRASAFAELGAATLGESGGRPMAPRIRAAWTGARISAPAFPAECSPGDNLAIHVAVAIAPPGHAIVASVGGEFDRGYWGEVLTTAAEAHGVAGLVIDGGVRDIDALRAHEFPAFSTLVALRGATKQLPGCVGRRAVVGDIEVELGDWVVGDADGVIVVPRAQLDEVLASGRARVEKERRFFDALRAGRTTLELLGLDGSIVDRP